MARKLRVEYPGAVYHVLNRGNRREAIFRNDTDRQRFLDTLAEACAKTGWQIHALCLMPNHFHLVVETPQPNLVAGMKWFLGAYTGGLNRRHRRCGHLFSRRYKSLVVDGCEMPVPTRGWCLGTERFREELLEPMEERMGGRTLREGTPGDDAGIDRADGGGSTGGFGMGGGGPGATAQGGSGQSGDGGAIEGGEHNDRRVDCRPPEDGPPGYLRHLLHRQRCSAKLLYVNIKN
ncbi:MAG: transposase [Verrucomicrobiales bacterium]|nr:transposase [Verrucomicrobiales bacterium]